MRKTRLLSLAALPVAFAQCTPGGCGPTTPAPAPVTSTSTTAPAGDCNPNYHPCIPNQGDLDCPDLAGPVTVVGVDVYRLDRDGDGIGCETD